MVLAALGCPITLGRQWLPLFIRLAAEADIHSREMELTPEEGLLQQWKCIQSCLNGFDRLLLVTILSPRAMR